ncbi:aminotransferase-like domain-containing protein [Paenibacillus pini]|uniref:Transcriptional regulator n=1 Tax=Paenibacillus pini JCM 16418 TaxID=1236976 RepID=W7Y920_9BACL|nr:PLP-dependent aminotransferase family protein [Paenibacillus pini]GAF07475.1 transcriptional regulator [Paenibacillus pini JCM 16418]
MGANKQLFIQIYDHIVSRMQRGEWQAHDKLPSIRQLANEFQIHRLTVFRAYQLLKQNGKAYVKEKSGYYVSPLSSEQQNDAFTVDASIFTHIHFKNDMSKIHRVPATYQFSQALIDPNLLPNLFLSDYVKKVFDIYPKMMGTYSSAQGDLELREVLCQYMMEQHPVDLDPDEVLITTGAQQAIDLLARLFIRPLDNIIVERPTYSVALDVFRAQGARFLPVDITPDGYDLQQVEHFMRESRPRFFYMNPTFHNPTGYTIPAAQRKRLVELAEQYQCLLIEDDAFHDMYFNEIPTQPIFTYDTDGWVIYLKSFSKYIAPGLRVCAVLGRRSLIDSLITLKSLADNGSPLVNQKLFLHYFKSERMQQHVDKLRTALQIRKEIMEQELAQTGWEWVSPQGGLNLWVKLPAEISVTELWDQCIRQSVSFVPGTIFDPSRELNSSIRLSYSFVNETQIKQGMRRLVDAANHIRSH